MKITSPSFKNGSMIPVQFTCKGANTNPQLQFHEVPEKAESLALVMHDPDAPRPGGYTHWVVFNIPAKTQEIEVNSDPDGIQINKYFGPCPPSGIHRYFFYLYALDTMLDVKQISDRASLETSMQGHVIEQAELMGTFSK